MIWIPALWANLQVILLGLDDLSLELFELVLLAAPITFSNRELAGRETITHYGVLPPMNC